MNERFNVGNHVGWSAEEGHVSGKIKKVYTQDFEHEGHAYQASETDPQYEIETDDHTVITSHHGSGLELIV